MSAMTMTVRAMTVAMTVVAFLRFMTSHGASFRRAILFKQMIPAPETVALVGGRGSNPRPLAWQAGVGGPTEKPTLRQSWMMCVCG